MEDDRYIPLSYISQYNYCKRRAGLLMLEQQWSDSTDTVKGTDEHKNVHSAGMEFRNGKYVMTEFIIFSKSLLLTGKCDAVEAIPSPDGISLPFLDDETYSLYPIEYKHGKLRDEMEYELQLCAQAMCLEEMYSVHIPKGEIFYISSHRRKEITLNEALRKRVTDTVSELSRMMEEEKVPEAVPSARCTRCSVKDICMPDTDTSVNEYMKNVKKEIQRSVV